MFESWQSCRYGIRFPWFVTRTFGHVRELGESRITVRGKKITGWERFFRGDRAENMTVIRIFLHRTSEVIFQTPRIAVLLHRPVIDAYIWVSDIAISTTWRINAIRQNLWNISSGCGANVCNGDCDLVPEWACYIGRRFCLACFNRHNIWIRLRGYDTAMAGREP